MGRSTQLVVHRLVPDSAGAELKVRFQQRNLREYAICPPQGATKHLGGGFLINRKCIRVCLKTGEMLDIWPKIVVSRQKRKKCCGLSRTFDAENKISGYNRLCFVAFNRL